jgi:hypothetical protein
MVENFAQLLAAYGLKDIDLVLAEKGDQQVEGLFPFVDSPAAPVVFPESIICCGCSDNCRDCDANPSRTKNPREEKILEIRKIPHFK